MKNREVKKMKKYLITSERANRRNDEKDNVFITSVEYEVGDTVILDGLCWYITKVCERAVK